MQDPGDVMQRLFLKGISFKLLTLKKNKKPNENNSLSTNSEIGRGFCIGVTTE